MQIRYLEMVQELGKSNLLVNFRRGNVDDAGGSEQKRVQVVIELQFDYNWNA